MGASEDIARCPACQAVPRVTRHPGGVCIECAECDRGPMGCAYLYSAALRKWNRSVEGAKNDEPTREAD